MNKVYTLLLVLLAALFGGNVYGQQNIPNNSAITENFTGYISRAQLFDKALTAGEIQSLMQQSKPDRK